MDCKTTNLTAQSAPDEISKKPQLCEQIFTSGEENAVETYSYQNNLLIKMERVNSEGNSIFTELTDWSEEKMRSTVRKNSEKTLFEVRYRYENGQLKTREIDDTNEKGELTSDGKTDREERFSYSDPKDDSPPLLTKISIERKNMPIILVDIEYENGLESKRTTRSDEKVLEVRKTSYVNKVKTQSIVELQDGSRLEYKFSYNPDGTLSETTRTGADKTPALSWVRKYDCKVDK